MRPLLVPFLAAIAFLAGPARLRADLPAAARGVLPETIEGEGDTADEAKKAALADAEERVWLFLLANHPEIGWKPTAQYLQRHNIVALARGPFIVKEPVGGQKPLYRVVYRLN